MLKFALVGNIASGKTTVQKYLEEFGYLVLDTDLVCHELLENSVEIEEAFSAYDVFDNGKISRTKLGKLVFENEQLKHALENLLYPDLIGEIKSFFEANRDKKVVFVAIPQLFEAGMEDLFDKILFVFSDDELRLERLIRRNNYTNSYARCRMAAQIPQNEKLKKSDYVIYNNLDLQSLKVEIKEFLQSQKLL